MKSPVQCVILLSLLLLLFQAVNAEIRQFQGFLEPSSFFLHYSTAYLLTPGSMDLSHLAFSTPFQDGGRTTDVTTIDIALFYEPTSCGDPCDWSTLGVGNNKNGGIQWCCTAEAVKYGHCTTAGRLIYDATLFAGEARTLDIKGNVAANDGLRVSDPKMVVTSASGKYVLIMANCNNMGREVMVDGSYTFKSRHGYLPADLFGEWHYFAIVLVAYIVLAAWYAYAMKQHYPESYISIQKWVLTTIVLGLVEALFRTLDYIVWNALGRRYGFLFYCGIAAGIFKHTMARCLLVMVSLGWGVTCQQIADSVMRRIRILGVFYLTVATAADVMEIIALTKLRSSFQSTAQGLEWFGAAFVLSLLLIGINVLYLIWILAAMTKTMTLLENSHQNRKLLRYRKLRTLLLVFSAYAIAWFVLMRSELLYTFLEPTQAWIAGVLMELDYVGMITGVAILWRPNEHAQDFAYDMQLPVGEEDGNELELTEDVAVPSALEESTENSQHFAEARATSAPFPAEDGPLPVEDGVTT